MEKDLNGIEDIKLGANGESEEIKWQMVTRKICKNREPEIIQKHRIWFFLHKYEIPLYIIYNTKQCWPESTLRLITPITTRVFQLQHDLYPFNTRINNGHTLIIIHISTVWSWIFQFYTQQLTTSPYRMYITKESRFSPLLNR